MVKYAMVFPEELLDEEKKEDIIIMIRNLPVDLATKKYMYMDWCKLVGAAIKDEDLSKLLGGRQYELRG